MTEYIKIENKGAYNKEYYHRNKEIFKKARQKYNCKFICELCNFHTGAPKLLYEHTQTEKHQKRIYNLN